jgi:uncharacterized protein (TIGR00159 family)
VQWLFDSDFGGQAAGWLAVLLDWALLTALGYMLLRLVMGTRAFSLLVGVVAVMFLYFFTGKEALDLRGVHTILGWFSGSLPVLIIILFQREIRWALTRFDLVSWTTGRPNENLVNITEELVKAATIMSEARIGALIALERGGAVEREMFNAGFAMNADVHWETLVAVFQPSRHNVLHDGGIVIRDGRIALAGVFFPLTQNVNIEPGLGTRHRAAIGLSETLDVVVLVVSEENGLISIAERGRLTRHKDINVLRADLAKRLQATRPAPRTGALTSTSASITATPSGAGS